MEINKILDIIRTLAPEELADSWDNSGVQVRGEGKASGKVAVALDPTPEFVAEALDWGAGLLLTHHPLYFDPVAPTTEGRYLDVLRMLIRGDAWLYAAHTSLDRRPHGPAQWLGRELGLRDVRPLEPMPEAASEHAEAGYGQVGRLEKPMAWDGFAALLGRALGLASWREVGRRPQAVSTVAYLPGSGSSAMDVAAAAGADVFVTGDLRYHQALEAPLCVLDVGHFSIEEGMIRRVAKELEQALPGVDVRFFPGADPFRFHGAPR